MHGSLATGTTDDQSIQTGHWLSLLHTQSGAPSLLGTSPMVNAALGIALKNIYHKRLLCNPLHCFDALLTYNGAAVTACDPDGCRGADALIEVFKDKNLQLLLNYLRVLFSSRVKSGVISGRIWRLEWPSLTHFLCIYFCLILSILILISWLCYT